jgi:bis(5'-nucleosyl)-tetraphosphatase (symmetrical)
MYIPSKIMLTLPKNRRLFVGDLHGCLSELNDLLEKFGFVPGIDQLFSVGDILGKGPDSLGTLRRLKELNANIVRGNHDQIFLNAAALSPIDRGPKETEYFNSLGAEANSFIPYIGSWPLYLELEDMILVHGGLVPGQTKLAEMDKGILMNIRTWDGKGEKLKREGDPAWFECIHIEKTVVFGHWAERGLIDRPRFKGLDTGCVYGGKLTGWCPEENRFFQVPAHKTYSAIHFHRS